MYTYIYIYIHIMYNTQSRQGPCPLPPASCSTPRWLIHGAGTRIVWVEYTIIYKHMFITYNIP